MEQLTDRQAEVLGAIDDWIKRYSYAPSTRDLSEILGIRSTSVVHAHLQRLRKMGFIDWVPGCARTLRVVSRDPE